jgi:hypothetical protein
MFREHHLPPCQNTNRLRSSLAIEVPLEFILDGARVILTVFFIALTGKRKQFEGRQCFIIGLGGALSL